MFLGVKCAKEPKCDKVQSVLRSKVSLDIKCSREQNYPGSKVCVSRVTLPVERKLDVVFRDDTNFYSPLF